MVLSLNCNHKHFQMLSLNCNHTHYQIIEIRQTMMPIEMALSSIYGIVGIKCSFHDDDDAHHGKTDKK
jgi:hypothetical protein